MWVSNLDRAVATTQSSRLRFSSQLGSDRLHIPYAYVVPEVRDTFFEPANCVWCIRVVLVYICIGFFGQDLLRPAVVLPILVYRFYYLMATSLWSQSVSETILAVL